MNYISVIDAAKKWNISERSVRNYCAEGRVSGAVLVGKTWMIPDGAEKPVRKIRSDASPETLLDILQREKKALLSGGIYHKVQIELTYNSNHIEGSRLTHDQTRYIFETNTIGVTSDNLNVDDIVETSNHFRCIDLVIENATSILTEGFIKELHRVLKNGTSDSRQPVVESAYVSAQLKIRNAMVLLPNEFAITVDMVTSVNCVNENSTSKLGQPTSTKSHIMMAPMNIPIIVIASPLNPANVMSKPGNNVVKNIHMHPSQNANIFLPDIIASLFN